MSVLPLECACGGGVVAFSALPPRKEGGHLRYRNCPELGVAISDVGGSRRCSGTVPGGLLLFLELPRWGHPHSGDTPVRWGGGAEGAGPGPTSLQWDNFTSRC